MTSSLLNSDGGGSNLTAQGSSVRVPMVSELKYQCSLYSWQHVHWVHGCRKSLRIHASSSIPASGVMRQTGRVCSCACIFLGTYVVDSSRSYMHVTCRSIWWHRCLMSTHIRGHRCSARTYRMVSSLLYTEWEIQDQSSDAMALSLDCEIHIILYVWVSTSPVQVSEYSKSSTRMFGCAVTSRGGEGVRQTQLMQTRRAPANVNGSLVNDNYGSVRWSWDIYWRRSTLTQVDPLLSNSEF